MNVDRELRQQYCELLCAHIGNRSEEHLETAARIGKKLVQSGVPNEEVVEIHEEALAFLVEQQPQLSLKEAAMAATEPLMELFIAYGLDFRRKLEEMQRMNSAMELEILRRRQVEEDLARQASELARSNKDLELFASAASHDLKAPLRQVSAFADLLHRHYKDKLDSTAEEFIDFIVKGTRRMDDLLNDLLEYSRMGRKGSAFERVDLNALLADVLASLQADISQSCAKIAHGDLPTVRCIRAQVRSLLQNLLSNGMKFRGDRNPEVHVTATDLGNEWEFSVADNGIGIRPDFHVRIFELFKRLHTTSEYPGTGIGLAICKRVVDRHGGQIRVESEEGRGATFVFTLPKQSQQDARPTTTAC